MPEFAPNWEGHYVIREVYDSVYFLISEPTSKNILAPINAMWLKFYYPSKFYYPLSRIRKILYESLIVNPKKCVCTIHFSLRGIQVKKKSYVLSYW